MSDKWQHYVRELELSTALEQLRGKNLLELGGGDGYIAGLLTARGFHVTSIDIAPKCSTVMKASAEALPFADASFDAVYSSHVLAHIHDKEKAFAEIRRVLKPNGIAVHVVPTPWWSILTNAIHLFKLPRMIAGSVARKLMGKPSDSIRTMLLHPLGSNRGRNAGSLSQPAAYSEWPTFGDPAGL